jgi:hypothetical protein
MELYKGELWISFFAEKTGSTNLTQSPTCRRCCIPLEEGCALWTIAFMTLASLGAFAFDYDAPIVQGAPRGRIAEETTSPKRMATAQTKPRHSAFVATRQTGGQQIFEADRTTQQGAPSAPRQMTQTADGYLWLAGISGLYRFDGRAL